MKIMSEPVQEVFEKGESLEGGGIKRAREDEEKGKTEEGSQKAQKVAEGDTPFKAAKEKEKVEEAEVVDEKGEAQAEKMMDVPPISEHRDPGDTHEEVQSLERGHIFFFYRPKVKLTEAHSFNDVQKMYIILYPDVKGSNHCRLLIVPKKRLPDVIKKKERVFSFVDHVGSIDDIVSLLRDTEYTTKKSGKRKQAGGRFIARGVYLLANHKEPKSKETFNNHVHLAYALTHPAEPTQLQKEFKILDEGDFVVEVKNPSDRSAFVQHKEMPREEVKKLFAEHKFVPLNPPEMIEYKGAEMVLIAAHHYPRELEQYAEKLETTADREKHKVNIKKIKTELHLAKNDPNMSLDPALHGEWS